MTADAFPQRVITPKFFLLNSSLGFLWAWRFCSYKTQMLFPNGTGTNIQIDPSWLTDCLFALITMAAVIYSIRRTTPAFRRSLIVLGTVLMSAGTFFTGLCGLIRLTAVSYFCGVATGIGSGILYVFSGAQYVRLEREVLERVIPVNIIWTLVFSTLAPLVAGGIPGFVVMMLLPVACGVILLMNEDVKPVRAVNPDMVGMNVPSTRVVVLFTALSLVFHELTGLRIQGGSSATLVSLVGSDTLLYRAIFIAVCLLLMWFYLVMTARAKHPDLRHAFMRFAPLMGIAIIIRMLPDTAVAGVTGALLFSFASTYLNMVFYVWFLNLAQLGKVNPYSAMAMQMLTLAGGVLLGSLTNQGIARVVALGGPADLSMFVAMLLLMVIMMLIPREENPRALRQAGESAAADGEATEDPDTLGSLNRRMSILAKRYGLTPREEEICLYLAKGRSRVFICEKLYLSKNTVDSHLRHVYAKMGIHTSRELLDILENVDVE